MDANTGPVFYTVSDKKLSASHVELKQACSMSCPLRNSVTIMATLSSLSLTLTWLMY